MEGSRKRDKFIFDTSAFLSLEGIEILNILLGKYLIMTVRSALNELEFFARYSIRIYERHEKLAK